MADEFVDEVSPDHRLTAHMRELGWSQAAKQSPLCDASVMAISKSSWLADLSAAAKKQPVRVFLTAHIEDNRISGLEADVAALKEEFLQLKGALQCFLIHGEDTTQRFTRLLSEWNDARRHISNVAKMTLHPAYLQMIGIGPPAIPLILAELEKKPTHLFSALQAITGVNPVPAQSAGRIKEMADAWLEWGRSRGQ